MKKYKVTIPWEKSEENLRLRKEISKRPYWWAHLNETNIPEEKELMTEYYEDLEAIVAATDKLPWDKLHEYQYEYQVGTFEGDVGLVQQAFDAALSQSRRTGVEFHSDKYFCWTMTPPCNLDIDIKGAGCHLLWGRSNVANKWDINWYQFDFFMSGREFVVCGEFDLHAAYLNERGGIEHLSVTLLRGEPLDLPCWGTLVS